MAEQWEKIKAPIVLSAGEYDDQNEKYLFYTQIEQVKDILNDLEKAENSIVKTSKNIAVIGDRGTGKTSFIKTLKNILEKKGYYVFDVVDPAIFDKSLNILEILVSFIYKLILKNDDHSFDCEMHHKRTEILIKLKSMIKVLANERQKDAYFAEKNPPIDVLEEINQRIELDESINKALNLAKSYFVDSTKKNKDFVLIIDDIDLLDNQTTVKLVRDIQKYLDTKIVIIIAYREAQLQNSLLNANIEENKILLEKKQIEIEELKYQNVNMISKLIPKEHRIYLLSQKELMETDIKVILEPVTDHVQLDITAKEWIYNTIFRKTNLSITPIDTREETAFFIPQSLRSLLQMADIITNRMRNINEINTNTLEIYRKNISIFKEFIYEHAYETLTQNDVDFLKNWLLKDSYQKNYFSYHYLYSQFQNPQLDDFIKDNDLSLYQPYNLTLGDVYSLIERYKDVVCKKESDFYFIYIFKTFYSLELITLFYQAVFEAKKDISIKNKYIKIVKKSQNPDEVDNIPDTLEKYLRLVNVRFMPYRFQYYISLGDEMKDDDIFSYDEKGNQDYINFISKIVYSDVAIAGDVRKGIIDGKIPFKYRYLNNYGYLNLTKKYQYNFDLYVVYGKLEKVSRAILKYAEIEIPVRMEEKLPYVFYSMFHIDMFVRMNYARRSNDGKIYQYAVNRLNDFMTNDIAKREENKLLIQMASYFGAFWGMDSKDNITQIYYLQEYNADEIVMLEQIKRHEFNEQEKELIKQLCDIDLSKKILKDDAKLICESLLIAKSLLKLSDSNEILKIQKRLGQKKTQVSNDEKEILINMVKKYRDELKKNYYLSMMM